MLQQETVMTAQQGTTADIRFAVDDKLKKIFRDEEELRSAMSNGV